MCPSLDRPSLDQHISDIVLLTSAPTKIAFLKTFHHNRELTFNEQYFCTSLHIEFSGLIDCEASKGLIYVSVNAFNIMACGEKKMFQGLVESQF